METIDKPTAYLLSDLLRAYGVRDIVVSPGSRCAPLTVALSRSGSFRMRSVIDERTAAFVGLGIGVASRRPVALVCTSGTAMLNYAPALAEAFYRRIPLIAVTADRPARLIDQRDSQTIRQAHALDAVVRKSVDIPDDHGRMALQFANRLMNDALAAATGPLPGPVHINMQFEVPLTPVTEAMPPIGRKIDVVRPAGKPDFKALMASVAPESRVLVIIGGMPRSQALDAVASRLSRLSDVAVYSEPQSNVPDAGCCFGISDFSGIASPDVLVTVGGPVVSAALKTWLRGSMIVRHINIGYEDCGVDTYGALSDTVECRPEDFLDALFKSGIGNAGFKSDWKAAVYRASMRPAGDVVCVLGSLAEAFPEAVFHISNGSAIRYAMRVPFTARHRVESNRGTSGIEGATSTAIGDTFANDSPYTVLVTGDMSFAYDIGALAVHGIPDSFRIVVLDNRGGDIFRAVATTRNLPERETFFSLPPVLPLKSLAKAYGFEYFATMADNPDISSFVACPRKAILHLYIEPGDAGTLF